MVGLGDAGKVTRHHLTQLEWIILLFLIVVLSSFWWLLHEANNRGEGARVVSVSVLVTIASQQ